jgi:hypothetical protein
MFAFLAGSGIDEVTVKEQTEYKICSIFNIYLEGG